MDIDLNIENYDLNDLLSLFKLDFDFTADDLKHVKKSVMQTHPDKSGLDKKYFLFFTSAYKVLYKIYEFRYKSDNKITDYVVEKNEENEAILSKIKNEKNFNKWFNEMFESAQLKNNDKETGYGDWMKSNEDLNNQTATKDTMNALIDNKKREMRALIIHNSFRELNSQSGLYDLTNERPETYTYDIFSKLQYDDLKRAHTESVVPVTIDDYNNRKKYNNINELQNDRSQQVITLSSEQSMKYLNDRKELETKSDIERAYKLAKQEEEARKINNNFWSKLKQLTN
jgi:hypothetical protein